MFDKYSSPSRCCIEQRPSDKNGHPAAREDDLGIVVIVGAFFIDRNREYEVKVQALGRNSFGICRKSACRRGRASRCSRCPRSQNRCNGTYRNRRVGAVWPASFLTSVFWQKFSNSTVTRQVETIERGAGRGSFCRSSKRRPPPICPGLKQSIHNPRRIDLLFLRTRVMDRHARSPRRKG